MRHETASAAEQSSEPHEKQQQENTQVIDEKRRESGEMDEKDEYAEHELRRSQEAKRDVEEQQRTPADVKNIV